MVFDGIAYGANRFIVQFNDGATEVMDSLTHVATTISAWTPDTSFPILKNADSAYIIDDGHIWFAADNWGIIGYKLPQ